MIWQAILLGALQGVTEFLPISSSGHLFLLEYFWGLKPDLLFVVWLHGATLLAVWVYYWKKIWQYFQEMFFPFRKRAMGWKLLLATFTTFGVSVLLYPFLASHLSLCLVGGTLLFTAFVLWISWKFRGKTSPTFTFFEAFLLGLVQAIAIFPGISRSGITVSYLLWRGYPIKKALEISFLLAIPAILGALIWEAHAHPLQNLFTPQYLLGAFSAFALALAVISFMERLVRHYWIYFALYCGILGGVILLWGCN